MSSKLWCPLNYAFKGKAVGPIWQDMGLDSELSQSSNQSVPDLERSLSRFRSTAVGLMDRAKQAVVFCGLWG